MTDVRALVVLQGGTALPEDRFVNTLHFSGGIATLEVIVAALHPVLEDFYNAVPAGDAQTVGSFINQFVQRSAEIRYYDLADPEPRVPIIEPFTLPDPLQTTELPEETAAVLSFRGTAPVTARRRGRMYLGPLITGAATDASTTVPMRVGTSFILTCTRAAEALRQAVIGIDNGNVWSIRSVTPAQNFVPIFGGWMDNAFDTQRRRGPDATARTEWGIPL